ncbi:MAG TPA: hypothetical protein VIN61_14860 [Gammaproteobacteria bacterium]
MVPVLGLLGFALALLLVLSLCKYGYTLLRWVAQGRSVVPGPGWDAMRFGGDRNALLHFVLFASLTFLIVVTPWLPGGMAGNALRACLAGAVVAAFPASAALVALTDDLGGALSPVRIGALVRTLGRRYALLLLTAAALFAVWFGAMALLWPAGHPLLILLATVAAVWTFLAAFALTGAGLRMARLEIDIPGDVDTRREELERRDVLERRRRTLDRAYGSIRSGLGVQGYRTIEELVADEGESGELELWIVGKMCAWDFPQHALRVGGTFIASSLARGEPDVALELLMLCRRVEPSFVPPPEQARALAAHARSLGKRILAEQLEEAAVASRP